MWIWLMTFSLRNYLHELTLVRGKNRTCMCSQLHVVEHCIMGRGLNLLLLLYEVGNKVEMEMNILWQVITLLNLGKSTFSHVFIVWIGTWDCYNAHYKYTAEASVEHYNYWWQKCLLNLQVTLMKIIFFVFLPLLVSEFVSHWIWCDPLLQYVKHFVEECGEVSALTLWRVRIVLQRYLLKL